MNSAYPCTDCVLHETSPVVCVSPHSPTDNPLFAVVADAPDDHPQLLWDELKEQGLYKSQAHVTTTVKCIPPEGYRLKQKEIKACSTYLAAELYWLRWETECRTILAVGTTAFKSLGGEGNITQVQGVAYEYEGFHIVPILHPRVAIRSPQRMDEFRRAIRNFKSLVTGKNDNVESEVHFVALR